MARRRASRGFTLIEMLVSTLLLSLFVLFYFEWVTMRATQTRQFAMQSQVEQVRRAVLAYAADARLRQDDMEDVPRWPADRGTPNAGMLELFRGGYLPPTLASVYPGGRWVFTEYSTPSVTWGEDDDAVTIEGSTWLAVRYEVSRFGATAIRMGRSRFEGDIWRLQSALDYWSYTRHAQDTDFRGNPQNIDCLSDLDDLSSYGKCDFVEFYLTEDSAPERMAAQEVSTSLYDWLMDRQENATICVRRRGFTCNEQQNVQLINMAQSNMHRWRRLIVGGVPGSNHHYGNNSLWFEQYGEALNHNLRGNSTMHAGVAENLNLAGWDEATNNGFNSALNEWTATLGNTHNNGTSEGDPMSPATQAGEQNLNAKQHWHYLTKVSGAYVKNLHLGHSWSEPIRSSGSVLELPAGTHFTRHYWAGHGNPRDDDLWVTPVANHNKQYGSSFRPASWENQPVYIEKATAGLSQKNFHSSFTAVNSSRNSMARDFTAINIGYAGFNKAILGASGLYTSNLRLGDGNSAYNTRTINFRNNGVSDIWQWQPHNEGLISYFTEFRFKNVTIAVNGGFYNSNNRSCATTHGLIDKETLNWKTRNCNHDHNGLINHPTSSAPGQGAPERQAAFHNFRDLNRMNGLFRRSDARLKRNIRPLAANAAALEDINPYRYQRVDDPSGKEEIGFIAQEVNAHYPELVSEDEEGYLSMQYDAMVPVLWGHLQASVKDDEQRIQMLKQKLALLEQHQSQSPSR